MQNASTRFHPIQVDTEIIMMLPIFTTGVTIMSMIIPCKACGLKFDDEFRTTICPHPTFAANDGNNTFTHHPDSYVEQRQDFHNDHTRDYRKHEA